jgi:hypothetical protein
MNNPQRKVLVASVCVVVVMLIFPPFQFRLPNGVIQNMGYGFIFEPPKYNSQLAASVNSALLLVQWIGVTIIGGALWFLARDK